MQARTTTHCSSSIDAGSQEVSRHWPLILSPNHSIRSPRMHWLQCLLTFSVRAIVAHPASTFGMLSMLRLLMTFHGPTWAPSLITRFPHGPSTASSRRTRLHRLTLLTLSPPQQD